jgi:hypothetical protein
MRKPHYMYRADKVKMMCGLNNTHFLRLLFGHSSDRNIDTR